MTTSEPEGSDPRRELLAPLGILLVVSGIVVILVAAFANPVVATAGPVLIASGIGLVVASEYRDEADMEYSRLGGLRLRTRKSPTSAAVNQSAPPRKAAPHRNRDPTRREPGCRLTQALSRRSGGGSA